MNFSIHQASHIGNRKFNQDRSAYAFSNNALLMILADGMGGHMHGELAASMTIDTFVESFGLYAQPRIDNPDRFIAETMRHAHQRIMRMPHNRDMGGFPGTTCVAVLIQDGRIYWGHAGDSRLYLIRDGKVLFKTDDHSMVQQMVEAGMISEVEARSHPQRNQITNCIGGVEDAFFVEMGDSISMQSGDVALLCSDGLWGPFTDSEIAGAFSLNPIPEIIEGLIANAVEREQGHSDNVTGLAVRWGDCEPTQETSKTISNILEIL